ncbi:MAG: methionine biosynthesis protein MetW, partial [Hyphomicrobium sp.]
IVSFPNFGHWKIRAGLLFTGRMPRTPNLPETWFDSQDSHLCTIKDFSDLVALLNAEVQDAVAFNSSGQRLAIKNSLSLQNLLGEKAVFLLCPREKS